MSLKYQIDIYTCPECAWGDVEISVQEDIGQTTKFVQEFVPEIGAQTCPVCDNNNVLGRVIHKDIDSFDHLL